MIAIRSDILVNIWVFILFYTHFFTIFWRGDGWTQTSVAAFAEQ